MYDEKPTELTPLIGKTVVSAIQAQINGYDVVEICFAGGARIVITEEGQEGWFSVDVTQ